ncbi:thiopurine S-methyltransferase [Deinococcus pimensis]|uniref:thiopurine S-methyltransferase n=1 Tax=Deinococcus pimensis TaxID=309888 RepID=UPI00048A1A59|nr:thiopurine S-methyltransferase [Deinococcus pimensis]
MDLEFWQESWARGGSATSFHRPDVHPFLETYLPPETLHGRRVLVPLCGKTNDLRYLARHARDVVGVEAVERAVEQFFIEHPGKVTRTGDVWRSDNLVILQRDFFDLSRDDVGDVDVVYDRAALVALPPDMRARYVDALDALLGPGARQLVITLEYAPELGAAPFSVSPGEVVRRYGARHEVMHLRGDEQPFHRMVAKYNLKFLREHAFLLVRRPDVA